MKIVPLNEVKNRFSTYLELSKREDIVVTKNGRPAAILHAVTDEDLEDYLFESDPRVPRADRNPPARVPAERGHTARRREEGVAGARGSA
jgi:prevent-host-death family protein